MGGQKRSSTIPISRSLCTYLESAKPGHISASWGLTCKYTSHLGTRYANGSYQSCILVETEGSGDAPMEGTIRNWGDTVPAMTTILAYCRSLFKVTPKYGPPRLRKIWMTTMEGAMVQQAEKCGRSKSRRMTMAATST
ncbi:hypothetical protein BKA56DRAFT_664167 [Ilyonectria sp. MPI-CAGE-AT-0026]|nr:hypothetical protein BKA56DRAFT_664167 [Ilyonectria sp. MPI-CAGE-AT-0026]